MNIQHITTALVLAGWGGNALAGPISLPYTFTPNSTAKASEVNGDFTVVVNGVNVNDARLTTIESTVTGGSIVLAPSTSTAGNIMKGVLPFIHDFGPQNTFIGAGAGNFAVTGNGNAALGTNALASNTSGSGNSACGAGALFANTTGFNNTAVGLNALAFNSSGGSNTGTGMNALTSNTTGSNNTAVGVGALASNTSGGSNTATGLNALVTNSTGSGNTAQGAAALFHNTTGINNTASGVNALSSNTSGVQNTAYGVQALEASTIEDNDTAVGYRALQSINSVVRTGNNTAVGANALQAMTEGTLNVAVGGNAMNIRTTGNNNIAIGYAAGSRLTGTDNNIHIGSVGDPADFNTIRIGGIQLSAYIAGVRGAVTANANAVNVLIDSAGQLGTINSSRKVKDHISDMGEASDVLRRLRPVTFYYKKDSDPRGRTLQYGLIAEEVDKVSPGLVARSADGKIETVYYQFLAPMLLNEYQKQQRTIEAQAARIAELESGSARVAWLEQELARMARQLARLEQAGMTAALARR